MVELLLELPDGSKSLVPAAWTDAQPSSGDDAGPVATLGSLADLLHVCELIAGSGRGQAAGMSPCKEDSHAACPAQFDARPGPGLAHRAGPGTAPPAQTVDRLPADAAGMAITLLANVIANAAAAMGSGVVGDE